MAMRIHFHFINNGLSAYLRYVYIRITIALSPFVNLAKKLATDVVSL